MAEKIYLLTDDEGSVCHVSRDKEKLEKILEAMKKRDTCPDFDRSTYLDWTIEEWDECDDTYIDNMPEKPLWHVRYCTGDYSIPMVHQLGYNGERHAVEHGFIPVHEIPGVPYINVYVRADTIEEADDVARKELHKYLKKQLENYRKSKEGEDY